jgi:hypothetical protein
LLHFLSAWLHHAFNKLHRIFHIATSLFL